MSLTLRPYQQAALEALREHFRVNSQRLMLYSPTGSGKTEIALAMASGAIAKGLRVLFLVHRIELVGQAYRRALASGLRAGIFQGSNTHNIDAPLLCASIQTVARRGFPFDVGLIVIDEGHTTASGKAYAALMARTNTIPTVGLTATPFARGLARVQEDGRPLWERLVVAAEIRELIDQGHLVDCDIYAPSEPDLKGVKIVAGDYHETQLGEVVDQAQLVGDIVSHWRRLAGGKRTVVFATNIAHSEHICEQFNAASVAAAHLDCYTSDDDRRAILDRLDQGETLVVSNCAVLAEGWDCPAVEVMVLARPTRSLTRYIQMAGRILRPAIGKENALILDHSGTCRRLGFPTDSLPLHLDDGKPNKAGKASNPDKLPSVCPSCSYLKPVGLHKCPGCGFEPKRRSEVQHQPGELRLLQRRDEEFTRAERQAIYGGLLRIQRERGYQRGWISHAYRELVGMWPHRMIEVENDTPTIVRNHLLYKRIAYEKRKQAEKAARALTCPGCGSTDAKRTPGKGPHAAGARCNACGRFWWLSHKIVEAIPASTPEEEARA
jgi:superfamily II DNA or RNA helicase